MAIINQEIKEAVAISNLNKLTFFTRFQKENGVEFPVASTYGNTGAISAVVTSLRDLGVEKQKSPLPEGYRDEYSKPPELDIIGTETLRKLAEKGFNFPGKEHIYPDIIETRQGSWTEKSGRKNPLIVMPPNEI